MPRGQWNAPGTLPSRCNSRGSRMSTSTTSSRPCSLIASSTERFSTSRSAASTSDLALVGMFWGMGVSVCPDGGRAMNQTLDSRHADVLDPRLCSARMVHWRLGDLFHHAVADRTADAGSQLRDEPLPRRLDVPDAGARHAHG